MPKYEPLTKDALRARIKEIEERIKQFDRREKSLVELKKWMATRKLQVADMGWMLRSMKPKRADKPVKSKMPLQPALKGGNGDPAFAAAIREARAKAGLSGEAVGKKIGVSGPTISTWERGKYAPLDDKRVKLLRFYNLPASLGADASAKASMPGKANGAA